MEVVWASELAKKLGVAFYQYKDREKQELLVEYIAPYEYESVKSAINYFIVSGSNAPSIGDILQKVKSSSFKGREIKADTQCRICEGTGMIKKKVKGYNMPLDFACECLRLRC